MRIEYLKLWSCEYGVPVRGGEDVEPCGNVAHALIHFGDKDTPMPVCEEHLMVIEAQSAVNDALP